MRKMDLMSCFLSLLDVELVNSKPSKSSLDTTAEARMKSRYK